MRYSRSAALAALSLFYAIAATGAVRLTAPDVTVGRNLQTAASLTLAEPVPETVRVKLSSGDPGRMLLSISPETAGAESITVTMPAGSRFSPEFFVQGLASTGAVPYTASASGLETGGGTVTLAPSGFVFGRSGIPLSALHTTSGVRADVNLYSALLDASRNYVEPQLVAGGLSMQATIHSSDTKVGSATEHLVAIAGGTSGAAVEFRPAAPGTTTLSVVPPAGFSVPAQFEALVATVIMPGMAMADDIAVGQNLQVEGTLHLGEVAPAGGVAVTLSSGRPDQLLLSADVARSGSGSITLHIPAGAAAATYYLQALGGSGVVTTTATASGYRTRTGLITLAPSGVVVGGPPGPPDEAELFRQDAADAPHGFVARLAPGTTVSLLVFTVQLDPVTRRSADITVQPLRAGVSLTATLQNSDPSIGTLHSSTLTIHAGEHTAVTEFTPLRAGSTVISVATPKGFEKSANATELTVVVAK